MARAESRKWVVGVDGCSSGWVCFKINPESGATEVEVVRDLSPWLLRRPEELAVLAIDIPIGLLDGPRACDRAARQLLGARCSSVFSPPCREALRCADYAEANATNRAKTAKGLSIQAWGIVPKIRKVDEAMTPAASRWVYEVHPEVSFWRLNDRKPMVYSKSRAEGLLGRLKLLEKLFPDLRRQVECRPRGVAADDLLDAAVAAWTARRIWQGSSETVCSAEVDAKGLRVAIHF